jgi:PD-(D/E)XK nuclease superfamily protein
VNSNQKGAIAEQAIALDAIKLGIPVLKPIAEHERYDRALDLGSRIIRVQCKWARRIGDVVVVHIARSRATRSGYVRQTYKDHEIDAVAAYCLELDRTYLLPVGLVAEKHSVQLRLSTPKNNQVAAINFGAGYELGAVAQQEERLRGTQEVAGSTPASSTTGTVPLRSERPQIPLRYPDLCSDLPPAKVF